MKVLSYFHLDSIADCCHGDAPSSLSVPVSLRCHVTVLSPGVWPASGSLHWFVRTVRLFVRRPGRNSLPILFPQVGTLTPVALLLLSPIRNSFWLKTAREGTASRRGRSSAVDALGSAFPAVLWEAVLFGLQCEKPLCDFIRERVHPILNLQLVPKPLFCFC